MWMGDAEGLVSPAFTCDARRALIAARNAHVGPARRQICRSSAFIDVGVARFGLLAIAPKPTMICSRLAVAATGPLHDKRFLDPGARRVGRRSLRWSSLRTCRWRRLSWCRERVATPSIVDGAGPANSAMHSRTWYGHLQQSRTPRAAGVSPFDIHTVAIAVNFDW